MAEISVVGSNRYATEEITGDIYYKRYDQGWMFEDFIFTGEHAQIHTYPTKEEVKQFLPNAIASYFNVPYEMVDLVKADPTDNECLNCEITLNTIENGYLGMRPTVFATLTYAPSVAEMWKISEATLEQNFYPIGIEGYWRGEWESIYTPAFDEHISDVTEFGFVIDTVENLGSVNERTYPQAQCFWTESKEVYTDDFLNFVSEPFSKWDKELYLSGYIKPDGMAIAIKVSGATSSKEDYGSNSSMEKIG